MNIRENITLATLNHQMNYRIGSTNKRINKAILSAAFLVASHLHVLPFWQHQNEILHAQDFCHSLGGANEDWGYSIVQATDGGYALTGHAFSFGAGGGDVYVAKLNSGGSVSWTRTIGGTDIEDGWSIIQTGDGGYAVAGYSRSYGLGNRDVYVVKLDGSGNVSWTSTVGGVNTDDGYSIVQTTDGGYAVAGTTLSFGAGGWDVYVVKLDGSGNLSWTRTVGGAGFDEGRSIIQTSDGGYAIAGYSESFIAVGSGDVYVIKLDGSGNLSWAKTISSELGKDYGYSIVQAADGGYVVAGYAAFLAGGGQNVYVVKLDGSGNLSWDRSIGGAGLEEARSIIRTSDGGYAVGGVTDSYGGGLTDVYVVKLNSSGSVSWTRTVGGAGDESCFSIVQTSDGGYAMTGATGSFGAGLRDVYVVKLNSDATTCCSTGSGGSGSSAGGTTGSGGGSGSGGTVGSGGSSGSGGTLGQQCIPLPVAILGFTGKCEENIMMLRWQTASETNNDYFSVERSYSLPSTTEQNAMVATEGQLGWATIGTVQGAGNSSTIRNYEFVDAFPPSLVERGGGEVYYRLRQTDYNGDYKYHGPISINCNPKNKINILPTVSSNGYFTITGLLDNSEIEVYNMMGEKVYNMMGEKVYSSIIHLEQPGGIYLMQIKTDGGIINKKIIIQK